METENPGTLGNGGMAASHLKDDLKGDIRGVIGDAEDLLRAVANLSGETVARARARLEERLAQVRTMLNDGEEAAKAQARQAVAKTDRYVHESPWQAIGIGLALGVVIGYLSHRR